MTVQIAEGVTLEGYSAAKASDVETLKSMYTAYLLEEFQRIGEMAFGNPVGDYLVTSFIRSGGNDAGFVSLDADHYSVEVVYVRPESRGQGLARLVLEEMNRHCPQTLALKTPLSPGGEALAAGLGLDRADNLPHEAARNEEALRIILASIKGGCPHKSKGRQSGDPRRPCRRCYQTGLRRYASYVIDRYGS
ncbi:hypothetical protein ACFYRJ_17275 [Streptomyces sp. NPDC005531]|uniref:hypothetical protein n=1 Tax=Streptomyces sp. NPDC005531 TaxID=3364722 RepID=UPI0036B39AD9